MGEAVAIVAIIMIIGGAVAYIVKAKKRGQQCIGCPYSSACGKAQKDACKCGENKTK